jgi:CBS domain-containing protein
MAKTRPDDTKDKGSFINRWAYSNTVYKAFITLVVVYLVVFAFLYFLQQFGGIKFTNDINGDILKLTTSLPLVAVWIVILIGAISGFARSSAMTRYLPFNKVLETKTIERSSIISKIRTDTTVKENTPFIHVANKLVNARLPILAVVKDDNTVEAVVTYQDLLQKFITEFGYCSDKESLKDKLSRLTVKDIIDIENSKPATITEKTDLKKVLSEMISHRFHKLIVTKEEDNKLTYSGTIDLRDIVEEIMESQEQNQAG